MWLKQVAAALAAAGVVAGIAEVAVPRTPTLFKGMPGSVAATAGRRLESVSLFSR
jgi:hypothetical protein